MDYPTFKKTLAHTGLTIRGLADLLGMNRNSITNYAKQGEVPTHLGVIVKLIAALVDREVDFRGALAGAQIRPKRKRGIPFGHPFKKKPDGTQTQAQSPRFWYPADLPIADTQIPGHGAAPKIQPVKVVEITRRGRRKAVGQTDGGDSGESHEKP